MNEIAQAEKESLAEAANNAKSAQENKKILGDAMKARYEAALQYEETIAQIHKQQLEQTRRLRHGPLRRRHQQPIPRRAGLSPQCGPPVGHHHSGNIGTNAIGTMQSHLSLQRDGTTAGILTEKGPDGKYQPNWLGKALGGTPFGIDAGHSSNPLEKLTTDNTDATTKNTNLIADNNKLLASLLGTIAKATGMPGSADVGSSSGSVPSDVGSTGSTATKMSDAMTHVGAAATGLTRAIKSGDIGAGFSSLQKLIGLGGTAPFMKARSVAGASGSGTSDYGSSLPYGADIPVGPLQLPSSTMDEQVGSSVRGDSDFSMPAMPLSGLDLGSGNGKQGGAGYSSTKVGYDPSKDQTGFGDLSAIDRFVGGLGSVFGGGSGIQAVQNVMYGGHQNSDGSWESASSSEQVGSALGVAADLGSGALTAYKAFSQGGARGNLQGLAATAETIAPFTGPAAPFLEAGGMVAGLVSALLPDPRQERIKNEQSTVNADAFVAPSSRDYDFSSGSSSGFSMGMGSSLRAAGPNANYTINFSPTAMDAKSFLDWGKDNAQAFSMAMLYGLQNGGNQALNNETLWQYNNKGIFG